jgi:hypothetical protein
VQATSPFEPGIAVPVAASVRRMVAANAGMMTGPGINDYLLGSHEVAALGAVTPDRLAPKVFDDVAPERHVWEKSTLQPHLIKLAHEGRVSHETGVRRTVRA